jgi:hypothetical protein
MCQITTWQKGVRFNSITCKELRRKALSGLRGGAGGLSVKELYAPRTVSLRLLHLRKFTLEGDPADTQSIGNRGLVATKPRHEFLDQDRFDTLV